MQILEFYLIELLGLLTGLGLLELLDLIYPRLSTWFCMLVTLFLLSFLQVVLDGNTQLKLDFLKGFHSPTYFLLFINDLLDDLICNIAICAADTTLLLMWSGIWSVGTTRICFRTCNWSMRHYGLGQEAACWLHSLLEKFTCFCLTTVAIDMKMDWSVLEEEPF